MRLEEIMNRNVATVAAGESAAAASQRMAQRRCHHLVVVDQGTVAGILSDRDLGGPRGARLREGKTARELMTPQLITADPRKTLRQAANLLRSHAIGCLPLFEAGKLVGIVTISDLLDLLGRGAERPVAKSRRWTLKHRGPRPRRAFIGR